MALRLGQLDERFETQWAIAAHQSTRQYECSFDYETYCDLNLKVVGLDLYSRHPSCEVLMLAYSIDGGEVQHHDLTEDPNLPADFLAALNDPLCTLWAYNAQFERIITERVLGITVPYARWRCSQVLGFTQSFVGGLDDMAKQCGLDERFSKDTDGSRLMGLFSWPQKVTKNQPFKRRDSLTDPDDWQRYCDYNRQDVVAEMALKRRLIKFHVPEIEWKLYAIDQEINDRGIPIDRRFVENAIIMSNRRKAELQQEMQELTGLANPNSVQQFIPWLNDRGYWFSDLGKLTVKKVLAENDYAGSEHFDRLTEDCVKALKLRQQAARASVHKYNAIMQRLGPDDRLRFSLQFGGASRTNRWAGRGLQPQNLPSTPGVFEGDEWLLEEVTSAIRDGDYDALCLYFAEPLDALSGLVRSAIRAPKGYEFYVSDLSSIESVVLGWTARCERILNIFRNGKDAYKDFATTWFGVEYDAVTKEMRKKAKPATLGCGYRLGGGELKDGKKTGLWGYSENMGIELTRAESWDSVSVYRETYPEVPVLWKDLEYAIVKTIKTHQETRVGPVKFRYEKPYLVCELPSGRCIYYFKPMVRPVKLQYTDKKTGEKREYMKDEISYMGKVQNGKAWSRIKSHGGKFTENIVQAIARDVLCVGMLRAYNLGFNICLHVHDELVALVRKGSKLLSFEQFKNSMRDKIRWAKNLPLGASGFVGPIYKKE